MPQPSVKLQVALLNSLSSTMRCSKAELHSCFGPSRVVRSYCSLQQCHLVSTREVPKRWSKVVTSMLPLTALRPPQWSVVATVTPGLAIARHIQPRQGTDTSRRAPTLTLTLTPHSPLTTHPHHQPPLSSLHYQAP